MRISSDTVDQIQNCIDALITLCRFKEHWLTPASTKNAAKRFCLSHDFFTIDEYAASTLYRLALENGCDWINILSHYVDVERIRRCAYHTKAMPIVEDILLCQRSRFMYEMRLIDPRMRPLIPSTRRKIRHYRELIKTLCESFLSVAKLEDFPMLKRRWFPNNLILKYANM